VNLAEPPTSAIAFDTFVRLTASPIHCPDESWRPWIIRLGAKDIDPFQAYCRERHITIIDTIDRQLMDLATVRLPSPSSTEGRRRFVADTLSTSVGPATVGNWIYFPWDGKMVHLLEQDDYFEVITNRNLDKITRDEQRLLRMKRIGVLGLSVGGEAAVTVAQEHLCGEIVLADFDLLDLSNLNRLHAGCDELGHKKAKIVARRIARIDPYLPVTILEDGVTATNVEAFLQGLDLLIEECDDLQIKHDVRLRAKARGVNVVFAADERGFLSVEPYAGQPDLRPFHGRITGPQPAREAFPTLLAFLKALTEWMGGWDNISERSRRSLERVGDTLCGYPQLASEARYTAGQIGHVARRLLLGEPLEPFIGNLDLAEHLPVSPVASR
jgi:tRNA threonylcarbamoyladenosine dehydratase